MSQSDHELRRAIVDKCLFLNASGLSPGTSGNISARHCSSHGERMLITPSATPYDAMEPAMIADMPLDGAGHAVWEGPRMPSTEWRFHRDILRTRPEVGAVVHAHPPNCTALAMARKHIPAAHYMIAAFGGPTIRCSDYATFGTDALSKAALQALEGRSACLLANHGMIAVGPTLEKAMWLAVELETLARQYILALAIGGPHILSDDQIAETEQAFGSYGLKDD